MKTIKSIFARTGKTVDTIRRNALALAVLIGLAAGHCQNATGAPVTFWFSGTITSVYNPSNALPFGVSVGMPFRGRVTYDSAQASYSTGWIQPSGSRSNLYCSSIAGVSSLLQLGEHTLTNQIIDSGRWAGSLHINNDYDGADEFTLYSGFCGLSVDSVGMTNSYMSWYLKDATKTTYSSAAFPQEAPSLDAFNTQRLFNWGMWDDANNTIFSVNGDITVISTNVLVALNLRREGNVVKVGWPTAVSGFALQCSTNLAAGNWDKVTNAVSEVGMERQVSLPASAGAMFFRLKAP